MSSRTVFAKICYRMLMLLRPSSVVFFPESGETAAPPSSCFLCLHDGKRLLLTEAQRKAKDIREEAQMETVDGAGGGDGGEGVALIKNGLMKPASDKVSSV